MFWSSFPVFWNNPAKNIDSPKLIEIVNLNPLVSIGDSFQAFLQVKLTVCDEW
jgi:ABC-type polysaccharide/polyol phosphate export permease